MNRFKKADQETIDVVTDVRVKWFKTLIGLNLLILFDLKKRTHQGRLTVARIKKADDVQKLLTHSYEHIGGVDLVMFLDNAIWVRLTPDLREKVVRHELRHVVWDKDEETLKLVGHEIEDFHAEILINKKDPLWRDKIHKIAESAYDEKGRPIPYNPNQKELFAVGSETPEEQLDQSTEAAEAV